MALVKLQHIFCQSDTSNVCFRAIRMELGHTESDIWDIFSHFHVFLKPGPVQWPTKARKIYIDLIELGYTVEQFFRIAMQPCSAMLKLCVWYDHRIPCEKLFFITKSVKGFCCSFNNVLAMKFNK